jgi:hypothetical protein
MMIAKCRLTRAHLPTYRVPGPGHVNHTVLFLHMAVCLNSPSPEIKPHFLYSLWAERSPILLPMCGASPEQAFRPFLAGRRCLRGLTWAARDQRATFWGTVSLPCLAARSYGRPFFGKPPLSRCLHSAPISPSSRRSISDISSGHNRTIGGRCPRLKLRKSVAQPLAPIYSDRSSRIRRSWLRYRSMETTLLGLWMTMPWLQGGPRVEKPPFS